MTSKISGKKSQAHLVKQDAASAPKAAPQKVVVKAQPKLPLNGSVETAKKAPIPAKPFSNHKEEIQEGKTKHVRWTTEAAERIQRAETLKEGGIVRKGSFAADAMARAAKEAARKLSK